MVCGRSSEWNVSVWGPPGTPVQELGSHDLASDHGDTKGPSEGVGASGQKGSNPVTYQILSNLIDLDTGARSANTSVLPPSS